ncbi:hypothetical protein [Microbispora sp. H10670]|uniref:hypothetical protein n=1 Tax=Microbispora sp. H10670 TaxID=2729108 RepID=UPI0015FF6AFE|nr:hypothetical protein [Microbispora sp. H10670]
MGPPERRRLFEEIYEAHYSDLLTYVWRRTGSPDDATSTICSREPPPRRARG